MKNYSDFEKMQLSISVTLLTAFLGFAFVRSSYDFFQITAIVTTIILLLVSIFSTAWSKQRFKIRKDLFDSEVKKFANSTLKTTLEQFDKYVRSEIKTDYQEYYQEFVENHSTLLSGKSEEEIKFYLDVYLDKKENQKKEPRVNKNFINILSHGLASEFEKIHNKCFKSELEEQHAGIKLFFDKFTIKYRAYLFILSTISFLVASTLVLL